jgi:hypothetical protein
MLDFFMTFSRFEGLISTPFGARALRIFAAAFDGVCPISLTWNRVLISAS